MILLTYRVKYQSIQGLGEGNLMEVEEKSPAKKVTGRSSRQDIWSAYNELLARIEKKPIESFSEFDERTDLFEKLDELKKETAKAIDTISDKASKSVDELSMTREEVKKEKTKMIASLNEQRLTLEDEIKKARRLWKQEQIEKAEKENELSRLKELSRRKEEDEYKYSIGRTRREETDKFNKEMSVKREDIEREKAEITARKSEISKLEKEVESLPATIDKAVKDARDTLTLELESAHSVQIRETKLVFENKENLLNARIINLESLSQSQTKELESLKKQLSDANDRLKEMAVSAIGARSDFATKRIAEEGNK